jgi:hypothetical protein
MTVSVQRAAYSVEKPISWAQTIFQMNHSLAEEQA